MTLLALCLTIALLAWALVESRMELGRLRKRLEPREPGPHMPPVLPEGLWRKKFGLRTVQPGETLWHISRAAYGSGMGLKRIVLANPIVLAGMTSGSQPHPGLVLRIPLVGVRDDGFGLPETHRG